MPEMSVEFEVFCSECGQGLCNTTEVRVGPFHSSGPQIHVDPCDSCIDKAGQDGYEKGYEAAMIASGEIGN